MSSESDEKSPFKAFVGIDFGTDGSGLAYALPDGNAYIHNMWDDTDPTQKPKTSVLFDKESSIIRVGTGAQDMYLKCTEDKGWKLFERFKMNLYEEPTAKSELRKAETKMDYVELKDEIATTNDKTVKESSATVFVAQLKYLKEQAFDYIDTHLRKKLTLTGDVDNGWPEIQYYLTVPAIWSDKAKDQMVKWAIKAGLITGKIENQLKIVYEPDCASLSIQHAILRAMKGDNSDNQESDKKKKKKKKKKMQSLIPKISINVAFKTGDKYILLDVGGGTCDVACHEVMGKFAIAEVLHPSGGKWGATYIDERFMKLLGELFTKDLINIFQMHERKGRQSYLKFLHYFLNEAKITYFENWGDEDEEIPIYHDIQMPANFVNFVITQYASQFNEGKGKAGGLGDLMDTADEQGMAKGLDDLNETLQDKSRKYQIVAAAASRNDAVVVNPTDDDEGGADDVNDKYKKRDWMVKIIEADEDDDDVEEEYLLSIHNDVWKMLFDEIIKPIIAHCKKILEQKEMKDTKYIFLVGGFANSKYFQMRMKTGLVDFKNVSIVTPGLPGLCVVDGAARYGMDSNFVKIRRLPRTYGIAVRSIKKDLDLKQFPAGHVDKYSVYGENGKEYVDHCFSKFVQKGDTVKLDDKPIKRSFSKGSKASTSVTIRIYSSSKSDPMTVKESDTVELGSVSVPIARDKQDLWVEFSFSNTLISVYAYPKDKESEKVQCKVDYM